MHDHDAFFTQTIVGGAFTAFLGTRRQPPVQGIHVDLASGRERLSDAWLDWLALGRDTDRSGRPRRRPGRVTRWMERHAFVLALAGAGSLCLGIGIAMIGFHHWR